MHKDCEDMTMHLQQRVVPLQGSQLPLHRLEGGLTGMYFLGILCCEAEGMVKFTNKIRD